MPVLHVLRFLVYAGCTRGFVCGGRSLWGGPEGCSVDIKHLSALIFRDILRQTIDEGKLLYVGIKYMQLYDCNFRFTTIRILMQM